MSSEKIWAVEELIQAAVGLNPVQAIRMRRDDLAALLWVDEIIGQDGTRKKLAPYLNRFGKEGWVFIYARVSTPKQRQKELSGEGWSMRTQFERAILFCVANGLQFCLFSDATLSGGMPTNDPSLIKTLWQTKANVYRSVMNAIFLPDYQPRPEEERLAIKGYIDTKCSGILSGRVNVGEEMVADSTDRTLFAQLATVNARGQETNKHIYRPGLNGLLHRLKDASLLLVTDSSRVARSQYLMHHILPKLREHDVETKGLIETWDWPNQDGIGPALQGSVLSALYEDMIRSATAGALRGIQTRLERGEPNGLLPFWYVKVPKGDACNFCGVSRWERMKSDHHLCPVRVRHAKRMVELYLDADDDTERGYQKVAGALERENIPPKRSDIWHWTSVRKVLINPALIGMEREFGLLWPTLDRIIDDEEWVRVGHKCRERGQRAKDTLPRAAVRHLLTGLPHCVCGRGMSHAPEGAGNYTCNMLHYARVGTREEHVRVRHSRLSSADMEGFFAKIFREVSEWAVSFIQDDEPSADRIASVRGALLEIVRQIPLLELDMIPLAEEELSLVPTFAQKKATPAYKQVLDATVAQMMEPHRLRRQALRSELDVLTSVTRFSGAGQQRRDVAACIAAWDDSSVHDKNAFLRMYFSELRLSNSPTSTKAENTDEGDVGGRYIIPILRDGVSRWPPIPLRISGTKAFRRRMPSVEDYIRPTYESVLAGSL